MSAVDWVRVKEIFADVMEAPAERRAEALADACKGDDDLRRAVESLLTAHRRADGLFAQPDAAPEPEDAPESIGPYVLEEKLGEGGFGVVYRARQRYPVEREVAIKLLKRGMDSAAIIRRFQAERQLLARMEHDDIARVLDAGATPDGRPFVVMELVRGEPIVSYCRRHDLGVRARVELMVRACRAVHHAHQRAVIHRDVKPSNILVTEVDGEPRPRIIDFGIAKVVSESRTPEHTRAGDVLGTPRYMSPEQIRPGQAVDIRTDVYSLGVVLCEVLTGRVPRDPETMSTRPLTESPAERPSRLVLRAEPGDVGSVPERLLRGDLDRIVLMCVAWDPDRRYESAAALAADLERYLRGEPVLAVPPSTTYRLRKFVGRHRIATALAAAAVLSMVGGTTVALVGLQRAIDQRRQADRQAARAEFVVDFFLRDLLDAANPDVARGEDIPVTALLGVARDRAVDRFADDPEILIDVLTRVGQALGKLSDKEGAVEVLAEAAAQSAAFYGPDHPTTIGLDLDAEVERIYTPQGHVGVVERRSAVRDHAVAALGPEHPVSLRARYYAAIGLEDAEYIPELLDLQQALRRVGMGRSLLHMRILRSLAIAYKDEGNLDRHLDYLDQALELAEAVYAKGHSEWAEILKTMAGGLVQAGRYDEAEDALDSVAAYEHEVLGPVHMQHLATNNIWIDLHVLSGHPDLALEKARESRSIAETLYGVDSIPHATSSQMVGRCLLEADRADEALPILEHALEVRRTQWSPGHKYIAITTSDLARACRETGDPDRAIELAHEALDVLEESDTRWLTTRITLAGAEADRGNAAEAAAILEDTIDRANAADEPRVVARARRELAAISGG